MAITAYQMQQTLQAIQSALVQQIIVLADSLNTSQNEVQSLKSLNVNLNERLQQAESKLDTTNYDGQRRRPSTNLLKNNAAIQYCVHAYNLPGTSCANHSLATVRSDARLQVKMMGCLFHS